METHYRAVAEQWREIAERSLGPLTGQTAVLAHDLAEGLRRRDGSSLRQETLAEAFEWLNGLRWTLNPLVRDDVPFDESTYAAAVKRARKRFGTNINQMFWPFPSARRAAEPDAAAERWPVDRDMLQADVQRYLAEFGPVAPIVERYMAAALAYGESSGFSETLISRQVGAVTYTLARNKPRWLYGVPLGKGLLRSFGRFLVAAVIGLITADSMSDGAALLAALGTWWFLGFRAEWRARAEQSETLRNGLLASSMASTADVLINELASPGQVRAHMQSTTDKGAFWPEMLWALMLEAERRCAWGFNHPGRTSKT